MLESFFRTHQFLVEHLEPTIRRALMDEVDWRQRLIGIKGSRGVGKTTFLLQYARDKFGIRDRRCLYINMNNLYFQGKTLFHFAQEFQNAGGQVLLVDQVFKQPDWSHELRMIYEFCPRLKVVFTGSSVMRLKEENAELNGIVSSYNLRGFSFREYLNLRTGLNLPCYSLEDIHSRHKRIVREITSQLTPSDYFHAYLHSGYYPFFLEKADFSENLLKTMNMMIEVDILIIKQIECKYLSKIKKLLYLLATGDSSSRNVSQLAEDMQTSRATVMNYIKYLSDARLLNMIYKQGDSFPKKPAGILLHNTNLMYVMQPECEDRLTLMKTFFQNALWGRYKVNAGDRSCTFLVNDNKKIHICLEPPRRKNSNVTYVVPDRAEGGDIPLWLYGFLY